MLARDVEGLPCRASGSRLRSLVGSALESAAGALPSWFTASSPDKPEADAPSASCPPQGASGTLNPPPTASASSRRRASSYDELLDDESAAGHGSSQSSNGRLQQPVSRKGNFGDGTASVMQQSHSNGVAELSPVVRFAHRILIMVFSSNHAADEQCQFGHDCASREHQFGAAYIEVPHCMGLPAN